MSENTVKREDALITSLREDVAKAKAHQHPSREDFFCLNLVAYMGERMPWVLHHIDAVERELALALKDNANYRATVQRLMSENRELKESHADCARTADLERAVVEAAKEGLIILAGLHFGTTWELAPYVKAELARVVPLLKDALDAAQQQPQHASAADDDGQDARQ